MDAECLRNLLDALKSSAMPWGGVGVFLYVPQSQMDAAPDPTLLDLEQTPYFPTNRKHLLGIPEGDGFHHRQHLGNIWRAHPRSERLFWRKRTPYWILFCLLYFPLVLSSVPGPKPRHPVGSLASPIPCQLPGLVPGRMQT